MKGVIIESGLEISVTVPSDSYAQGDTVRCTLTVKNRSTNTVTLPPLLLQIAVGIHKKVKGREAGAFEVLASAPLAFPNNLAPSSSVEALWEHTLAQNAVISEKTQSLYLLFGSGSTSPPAGQLPLSITPHRHLEEVIRTMEMVFQFTPKGIAWKDGAVIVKYKPPSSREYTLVEELSLGLSRSEGNLVMRYRFKVKKFESSEIGVQIKKGMADFERILAPQDYLFGGDYFNQDRVEGSVSEALKKVQTGF
jgi:hypothetical protein